MSSTFEARVVEFSVIVNFVCRGAQVVQSYLLYSVTGASPTSSRDIPRSFNNYNSEQTSDMFVILSTAHLYQNF